MAKVLFVFILALNIHSSFSSSLIQQNEFVKRAGGLAVHNSGNLGQGGHVPFAGIHQHQGYQTPIENRVIRLSKPVNRPPELPAEFPVGQPRLQKVQYEEDKKQYGLIGGRKMIAGKKENPSTNTNQQQEVEDLSTGMKIVSPFAIYGGFHIGKEFGLMAKKVCNFACQKAKELKERNRLRNLENSRSTLLQSSPSASTSSSASIKSRSRGIHVQPSFSQSLSGQHFVKRAGEMTTFNSFHGGSGNGQTPFSSTNPNQSPVQSRVIRTRDPVNRPPELPSNHPIVKPKLPKVEYKDDQRNEKKKQKEKNEPLLHSLAAVLTPIGMFVSQDVIFENGKYTKLANRKMKQKVKEVCDAVCRKAKQIQNQIFPQSVTKDYGQLQRQNIHNAKDKKQLKVLITRKGPIHERPNDFEATSSEGWKETKILYSHLLESPPPKYKYSPPHSLEFSKELEPNNKFEWMNQNDAEKENPMKFLFHIEGPGKESKIRAMNSKRTGKSQVQ